MPNVFYFGTPVPTVGGCILAAVIAYLLGSISGALVSSKVGHKNCSFQDFCGEVRTNRGKIISRRTNP